MVEADAIIFGSPTRYGNMSAELKLFLDTTGPLWVQGKLIGKVAAVFCTNSTAHSGKESTLLSMMFPLVPSRHNHRRRASECATDSHCWFLLWCYCYLRSCWRGATNSR